MIARLCAIAVTVLLFASGCTSSGGDDDTVAPSTTATPETTATAPTTAEALPVETESPSTTSEAPLSDDDQVRQVHTRFMTELFNRDERTEGVVTMDELEELTTGAQLARSSESASRREATGERVAGPGYGSNVLSIEVSGENAVVVDCSQDQTALYDGDGSVLVPADDFFKIRMTSLVRIDERWFVEDFNTGGDQCDPDDS